MYAVILSGGKQFRVAEGQKIKIDLLNSAPGETVEFKDILMIADGDSVNIGAPLLKAGKVTASIVEHGRHKKVKIIKFRRRKHHMKQMGHRQYYTEVRIDNISA